MPSLRIIMALAAVLLIPTIGFGQQTQAQRPKDFIPIPLSLFLDMSLYGSQIEAERVLHDQLRSPALKAEAIAYLETHWARLPRPDNHQCWAKSFAHKQPAPRNGAARAAETNSVWTVCFAPNQESLAGFGIRSAKPDGTFEAIRLQTPPFDTLTPHQMAKRYGLNEKMIGHFIGPNPKPSVLHFVLTKAGAQGPYAPRSGISHSNIDGALVDKWLWVLPAKLDDCDKRGVRSATWQIRATYRKDGSVERIATRGPSYDNFSLWPCER